MPEGRRFSPAAVCQEVPALERKQRDDKGSKSGKTLLVVVHPSAFVSRLVGMAGFEPTAF